MVKKRGVKFVVTASIFLFIILNFSFLSASQSNEEINISVEFHSSSVIREGYKFPASITIQNLNENSTIEIKKITLLNDGKKIVKTENINKELNSLKKDFWRVKGIKNYLTKPDFCENSNLMKQQPEYQELLGISSKIENETFQKSFDLDIRDFEKDFGVGD